MKTISIKVCKVNVDFTFRSFKAFENSLFAGDWKEFECEIPYEKAKQIFQRLLEKRGNLNYYCQPRADRGFYWYVGTFLYTYRPCLSCRILDDGLKHYFLQINTFHI